MAKVISTPFSIVLLDMISPYSTVQEAKCDQHRESAAARPIAGEPAP